MASKPQKANRTNRDSVLSFLFQKTQNKITFPDVQIHICESSEQQSNYSKMGQLLSKVHREEEMLCGH